VGYASRLMLPGMQKQNSGSQRELSSTGDIRFQPFSYAKSILNTPKKVWIQQRALKTPAEALTTKKLSLKTI